MIGRDVMHSSLRMRGPERYESREEVLSAGVVAFDTFNFGRPCAAIRSTPVAQHHPSNRRLDSLVTLFGLVWFEGHPSHVEVASHVENSEVLSSSSVGFKRVRYQVDDRVGELEQ